MADPDPSANAPAIDAIDYALAFELAPIGLVLSRQRVIVDCNQRLCEMFGATREQLVGQSFRVLYPSTDEFERTGARIAPLLGRGGTYADDRIMRRALRPEAPHEAGIWSFEDLSAQRPVRAELTPREREVAALVMDGKSAKQIGRLLGISHRTVEVYRASLMRKYGAATTAELVHRLLAG